MADTGWVIAGSGDTIDTDAQPWTSPGNITADDVNVAYATVSGSPTDSLKAYNFGLSVPTGSTIDGIEVRAQLSDAGTSNENYSYVNVGKDDSTLGTNKDPNVDLTTMQTNYDEGGASDLWNLSFTAAEVNASSFQVRIKCDGYGYVYCDAVWVKVHYTPAVGRSQFQIIG